MLSFRNGRCDGGFHDNGLHIGHGWYERRLPFRHRRSKKTKQHQSAQQAPHDNDWFPRNDNPHGCTSGYKGLFSTCHHCNAIAVLVQARRIASTSMFYFEDPQPLLFWGTAGTKHCKAAHFGAVAANYDDDRGTKRFRLRICEAVTCSDEEAGSRTHHQASFKTRERRTWSCH